MNYVILDLEWNNAYVKKRDATLNEIIEVGAVLLDERLEMVDTFRTFIRASLGKKLHGRVKKLTNISNQDISTGYPFTQVMSEFRKWLQNRECIVLTWGFTDIKVLSENFKYFSGTNVIPFLHQYADLQLFVQKCVGQEKSQQLGLQAAADLLHVSTDDLEPHRALSDSIVSARCLQALWKQLDLSKFVVKCDEEFYHKMDFKPYYITDLNSPEIEPWMLRSNCPYCNCQMKQIKHFSRKNHSFSGIFYCSLCTNEYRMTVRFKRRYEGLEVKRRLEFVEQNTHESIVYAHVKQC